MKEMIVNKLLQNLKLYKTRYNNGQLAIFVHNHSDEPILELSIMEDSVELAPDEFILKDYSENEKLAHKWFHLKKFSPTSRFVLIGSHLCPICKVES